MKAGVEVVVETVLVVKVVSHACIRIGNDENEKREVGFHSDETIVNIHYSMDLDHIVLV